MLTEATEESEQVVVEASHMHGVEISSMAMFRCEASYNIYFPSLPRICVGTPRNSCDLALMAALRLDAPDSLAGNGNRPLAANLIM